MIPLLVLAVVVLGFVIASLKSRLDDIQTRLDDQRNLRKDIDNELAHVTRRLLALETRTTAMMAPIAPPAAADSTAPSSSLIAATPAAETAAAPAPKPVLTPAIAASAVTPRAGESVTVRPSLFEQPPAAVEPATAAGWEMTVGGNWLNKLGVLVFVVGLALLVRYYSGHIGPAGRDAMGFVVSFALLGLGIRLERRGLSRNYAYGLIAGGWAGIYFTTYAMHAIDAARVIDSDVIGIALLSIVAAAMIAHSLRFKSETVTVLAYVVGYATLMLSPLDTFAIVAAGVLAATSLVVAERYGWSRVVLLTSVATYGTFFARREILGRPEADVFPPLVSLGAYWLMFEAADMFALRRQRADGKPLFPLFLVNAAGFVGVALLEPAIVAPDVMSTFLGCAGAAYLASAVMRSRLLAGSPLATQENGAEAAAFGSSQGAVILSAGLMAWAILARFHQPRATFALLVEMELLFLSAIAMRDRVLRAAAVGGAAFVTLVAVAMTSDISTMMLMGQRVHTWAPVAFAVAFAWYLNTEFLQSRTPSALERGYSYAASALMLTTIQREIPDAWAGLALLGFAAVLLEAGMWRARDYRWQAYFIAGLGTAAVLAEYIVDSSSSKADAVLALSASSALGWLTAARARWQWHTRLSENESGGLAVGASAIGLLSLATLEWWVVPAPWVAVVWALTALVLVVVSRVQGIRPLAWLADPLMFAAGARLLPGLMDVSSAVERVLVAEAGVIAAFYVASVVIAPGRTDTRDSVAEPDDVVRVLMSLAGSALLMTLIHHDVTSSLVTVGWGLQGAALLGFGFPLRERTLRLSGLGMLLICILRLFIVDLSSLDPLARIVSYLMLGAVMLGVSWVYTRYRDTIGRYL